ncbi:hypothetical protein KC717_05195 [Candidatus Dojkabacteria bacterium]|uniref:Uncharacterized protein n=1 Tax=Candidatus Dojkabacteria bacterium TaxID=2099670 RepID=A0A955L8J3_9BACT|nr:hypothetical protein [Candidatus Dojkabacteria bacterium]
MGKKKASLILLSSATFIVLLVFVGRILVAGQNANIPYILGGATFITCIPLILAFITFSITTKKTKYAIWISLAILFICSFMTAILSFIGRITST